MAKLSKLHDFPGMMASGRNSAADLARDLVKARDDIAVINQRLCYEQELNARKKRMARPAEVEIRGLLVLIDRINVERFADYLCVQDQGCTTEELAAAINAMAWLERAAGVQVTPRCRKCGCTEVAACVGSCWWVEPDLCSSCAPRPAVQRLKLKKVERRGRGAKRA